MGTRVSEKTYLGDTVVGRFLYKLFWALAWVFLHLVCRLRVEGREHIAHLPVSEPVLIVSNHLSWCDPLLLGLAFPRRVWFLTKVEAFQWPIVGWIMRHTGQIAVHRGEGDRIALETAVAYLQGSKALVIFPEGTVARQERMIAARPGVAVIVARSHAVVVPVALSGARRILRPHGGWRPHVSIHIGVPYVPVLPEGATRKAGLQMLTDEMMSKIAEMLPLEQRGIYS